MLWIMLCASAMSLACSPEDDITPDPCTDPSDKEVVLPEELIVHIDFKAGWPFNEPCAAASDQIKEGESYAYTYMFGDSQSDTMILDFVISHGTVSTSLDYSYSDGALRFNSTGGNNGEIKLPGIEGYYLSRVDAIHISAEKSRFALKDYFIAKTETLTERLLAGWAATGALTTFWMPVTEGLAQKQQPGQSFTLEMRDKNMAVSEIKLVYTKTKPAGEPPLDLSGKHLYAHRGKWSKSGSDYFVPENSITGIQMAALMGYEGIECDVKYTKDKVLVVMHDATINKSMRNADYTEISGDVKVANLTFEELRNNYVLESTEPAFRLQCPTLEEMLLECKRCGMRPMLHSSIYESYELAQKIMGDNWVCFTGDNFENVLKVRSELKSNCTILWSVSSGFDTVENQLVQIGGDCGISSMESGYYTPEMISRLRNGGYHVQCSIFPSGEERLAIENGVDYILSDNVIPEGARTDITAEEILAAYPPLPDEFTISLDFTAGWPFEESCVEKEQQKKSGETYNFTFTYNTSAGAVAGNNMPFTIFKVMADDYSNIVYYDYSDGEGLSSPDLQSNYSIGFKFPGIADRYLKHIKIDQICSHPTSPGRISATSSISGAALANEFTFPVMKDDTVYLDSSKGHAFYYHQRRGNLVLKKLTLTYTKTKPE